MREHDAGPIHVIGASGRSGAAQCRALLADGVPIVPVVRNAARWQPVGSVAPRIADLGDASAMALALGDAQCVVSCAHARHVPAILAAAPAGARFVFLGSTRTFTRWPDAHGDGVQRLAALLRRLPVVPLPDGGRALVQPIHQ